MPLTFEDLTVYQLQLKSHLKLKEPNLAVCFILESHDTFIGQKKLGSIVLGIRDGTGNFTSKQCATIYNNRYLENAYLRPALYNATLLWLYQIKSEQERHTHRSLAIKDELLSIVWHPDNVRRLLSDL